jgi:oligopeptide/dipeptide ABC transporter ATP-binding protein
MLKLVQETEVAMLVVTHDLGMAWNIADRIAVMYLGRVVEQGTVEDIFAGARHPYTKALLSALPAPDPDAADSREHVVLTGDLPSAVDPPSGCHFHPRCPKARADCREQQPPLEPVDGDPADHPTACWHPLAHGESLSSAVPGLGIASPEEHQT